MYEEQENSEKFDYERLEELNHALEVERELVLKAHENYTSLKKKFIELREEHKLLQDDVGAKNSTIKERMENAEKENEKLSAQNENLLEEIQKLKDELKKKAKEMTMKEKEMKKSFNEQIEELLEHTAAKEEDDIENKLAKEKEEFRKTFLLNQDGKVNELLTEIKQLQAAYDEEMRTLRAELSEERQLRVELATSAQRMQSDLTLAKKTILTKQSDAMTLRCELNRRLKENMEKELAWLRTEENFRRTLSLRTTSFEEKIDEFQQIIAEKDELITNLRQELEKLQKSVTADIMKREKMNVKIDTEKNQIMLKQEKEDANKEVIEQLKIERNNLEKTVVELKKQLESSPANKQERKRLKQLLHEKDEKLRTMRRYYRQLIRKVENSLVHLEKQHMNTKRKLEESILS